MERTKLNYTLREGVQVEILIDFEDGILYEVRKTTYTAGSLKSYEYHADEWYLDSWSVDCEPHKIDFDIEYIMDLWKFFNKEEKDCTDFLYWNHH